MMISAYHPSPLPDSPLLHRVWIRAESLSINPSFFCFIHFLMEKAVTDVRLEKIEVKKEAELGIFDKNTNKDKKPSIQFTFFRHCFMINSEALGHL